MRSRQRSDCTARSRSAGVSPPRSPTEDKGPRRAPWISSARCLTLRGCEPGKPGGCPAAVWQSLGRTQTPFYVVLVHVYTQQHHADEIDSVAEPWRYPPRMDELIGDSARGEEFALVR